MGVSKNSGTPKLSILIRFSIIFTIHFGGFPPIFGVPPIWDVGKCKFLWDFGLCSWMWVNIPVPLILCLQLLSLQEVISKLQDALATRVPLVPFLMCLGVCGKKVSEAQRKCPEI